MPQAVIAITKQSPPLILQKELSSDIDSSLRLPPPLSSHLDSSLQSCESKSVNSLDPKRSFTILDVFENFDRLSTLSHDQSRLKIEELQRCLKDLEKEWALHSEKMLEADALQASYSFWSQVQDFFSFVTGAFGAVFGISALSTGNIATGSFLIASASLSFSNLALKYGHLWDSIADTLAPNDPTLKQSLLTYLPLAFAVVTCGVGIYGGYSALSGGGPNTGYSLLRTIHTATNLASACASFAAGRGGAKVDWKRAEMTVIERDIECLQEEHEEIVRILQEGRRNQTTDVESFSAMTEAAIQALLITSKPV